MTLIKRTLDQINKDLIAHIPYAWGIWAKLKSLSKIGTYWGPRLKWTLMFRLESKDEDVGSVIAGMANLNL